MTIYIVACGEKKSAYPDKAKNLYQGNYFSACYGYAQEMSDRIFIISAKYGLISPDEVISPYNLKMGSANSIDIETVRNQAVELGIINDDIVILGGSEYVKFLRKIWPNAKTVLSGGLLSQIKWLGEQTRAERAKKQLKLWGE